MIIMRLIHNVNKDSSFDGFGQRQGQDRKTRQEQGQGRKTRTRTRQKDKTRARRRLRDKTRTRTRQRDKNRTVPTMDLVSASVTCLRNMI